ncbi:MAG: L,D-transpeptidase family protein [Pseudomonadales bacterium]
MALFLSIFLASVTRATTPEAPTARSFNPQVLGLYEAYEAQLKILRKGGWPSLRTERSLREGDQDAQVASLRERLRISGDLPTPTLGPASQPTLFDVPLTAAVMAFQARHGLEVDGVVGARTRAALNVTAVERLRQLAINIQRWDALPADFNETFMLVNLPEFELQLYQAGEVDLAMRVVIGKKSNPTPQLVQQLEKFVLNPTWFVPKKIGARELLPKVQANPDYLGQQRFDVYNGKQRLDPASISWDSLSPRGFEYSFRQRPGPGNSLGRVKFMLPNSRNIYLHDTPHKGLFAQHYRAYSHGCVRLEQPLELARALLSMQPDWTQSSVERQLQSQRTVYMQLAEPLPVFLSYLTAKVENSKVSYFEDLYGHDRKPLQQAVLPSEVVATLAQLRGYHRALRSAAAGDALVAVSSIEL